MDDHRSEHEQPDSTGRSKPPPILLAGEPGWVSGPCYGPGEPSAIPELTLADLAAATGHRGWEITDHGDYVTAEHRAGSALRVLTAHTAAGLAARIADAEAAGPGEDPAVTLAGIARDHPTWAIDPDSDGHGVAAQRGDVRLLAFCAAELAALLDLADPMVP